MKLVRGTTRIHGQTRIERELDRQAAAFIALAEKEKKAHKRRTKTQNREARTSRSGARYAKWRIKVLARDGFKCLRCGSKENLHVHHCMVGYARDRKRRLDVSNGATLCVFCHAYEHPWMIPALEKQFGADTVAFEIAGREYRWGVLQTNSCLPEVTK